jgi:hypothetical protein
MPAILAHAFEARDSHLSRPDLQAVLQLITPQLDWVRCP